MFLSMLAAMEKDLLSRRIQDLQAFTLPRHPRNIESEGYIIPISDDMILRYLENVLGESKRSNNYNELDDNIDHILFNEPVTVVFWKDGTKTVVRCSSEEKYDPEKGLLMALHKRRNNKYYEAMQEAVNMLKDDPEKGLAMLSLRNELGDSYYDKLKAVVNKYYKPEETNGSSTKTTKKTSSKTTKSKVAKTATKTSTTSKDEKPKSTKKTSTKVNKDEETK